MRDLAPSVLKRAALVLLAALVPATPLNRQMPAADGSGSPPLDATLLRPSFHSNLGQFPSHVRYAATVPDGRVYLTDDGAVAVRARGSRARAVGWRFAGARAARPGPERRLSTVTSYFVGDPSRWRTHVPGFERVRYSGAYRGIDVVYYGRPRAIEFDLEIAPDGDPQDIRIAVDGATSVDVDRGDGALVMRSGEDEFRWQAPVAYQTAAGARTPVAVRYVLDADRRVGFEVGKYDRSRMLVIDPVLLFSTFVGGTDADSGRTVAVNAAGEPYIVGSTASVDFPATPGAHDTTLASGYDAFVARLSADGSALQSATYLGGGGTDGGFGLALDSAGFLYVTGATTSPDFPSVNGYQPAYNATRCTIVATATEPCRDAFVAKLTPNGDALVYSTFFGGSHHDGGAAIAVGQAGDAYVLGTTQSGDLPLFNAPDPTYVPSGCGFEGLSRRCADAFVARFSPAGSALVYSTYLGGDFDESAGGIAVDATDRASVVGATQSLNFPVAAALQPAKVPGVCGVGPVSFHCFDLFIARIAPAGGVFDFSTYFGGDGDDHGKSLALGADGTIWLAGHTNSPNLRRVNALQSTLGGPSPSTNCLPTPGSSLPRCPDALIARLDSTGSVLLMSSYLGGANRDEARAIAVNGSGRVAIGGHTQSSDFPVVDAWQWGYDATRGCPPSLNLLCADAFVTVLQPAGTGISFSTYLGGAEADVAESVAFAPDGSLIVGGVAGPAFPTTPGAARQTGSNVEAFVARLAAPPAAGMLVTFAGTGRAGATIADGMQALRTPLGVVMDVAVQSSGLRFVADAGNHRILRIDAANTVTVIAGTGTAGSGGDDGPAALAQLNTPSGVAVDYGGNVFIADSGNHRIRVVTPAGVIYTIAGTGAPGNGGDWGPSVFAELNYPTGVLVYGDVLLVADTFNHRVRMITSALAIFPIAGNGTPGSSGDGGFSLFASLALPTGLAADAAGRLLIADFGAHNVRRVDPDSWAIATIAGSGVPGSAGDGGPATAAQLNGPWGIDVAPSGDVLIAELHGHRIRAIAPGGTIATVAGTGTPGGIRVPPSAAALSPLLFPSAVALDGAGNVLLADAGNYRIALLRRAFP